MKDKNRSLLYKNLPLNLPYLLQIFPVYACNFKCGYCIHAVPPDARGFVSAKKYMDMETYTHTIDELAGAGGRLKMLRFAAMGEPLLHPQIAEMVAYAKERGIAEKIDIVTNAALLTPELSDKLTAAGLSTLRVSLEGLSSEEYKENAGANADYDKIVENIRYFYEHRGDTKVYVKIIDYMLKDDPEREKLFYDTFSPISDITAIEHLVPTVEQIDYGNITDMTALTQTQDGEEVSDIRVCPQAFYILQLNPDGKYVPCCSTEYPVVVKPNGRTLLEVWNGPELTALRRGLLTGDKPAACEKCSLYKYGAYPEDVLDGHEEEILQKF